MKNKQYPFLLLLLALALTVVPIPGAFADTPEADKDSIIDIGDPSTYRSDQIIITYDSKVDLEGLEAISDEIVTIAEDKQGNEIALVDISHEVSVEEAITQALDEPGVIAAQPDYLYSLLETTNDPLLGAGTQWWWLEGAKAYQAWDFVKTNHQVTAVVMDTGVNINHEDLVGNIDIANAWDAVANQPLLDSISSEGTNACGELSTSGHGTHVSGIIGATADNAKGGAGISYNANILPIRVFSLQGSDLVSSTAILIRAYDYIFNLQDTHVLTDIRVVSMSLGEYASGDYDVLLHKQVIKAADKGILTVAAAGNTGRTDALYPSDWPEVFSVMPTNINQQKPVNYDINPNKNICAPGINIYSTSYSSTFPYLNDNYGTKSGSSMAAPVVTGIACLVWAANPDLSVAEVKQILLDSAIPFGADTGELAGFGRVDAEQAVRLAIEYIIVPPVISLEGFYTISSCLGNNLVFDIAGASKASEAAVTSYTSNHTVAQVFQLILDESGDYYIIMNPSSRKVLDVPGAQAYQGQKIWQYQPNGTDAQKWLVEVLDDGSYLIKPKLNPNLCIDIQWASTAPGVSLWLYSINQTNAQRFRFSSKLESLVPEGVYTIGAAVSPQQLVDVAWGSSADMADIHLWQSNNTNAQLFRISFDPYSGMYQIINIGSWKAVDVAGAGASSGTNVWQYSQNGTYAQRWYIEQVGGYYRFYAAHSGMALDAPGGRTANSTSLWTYTPNGTPAQNWCLTIIYT
jgi:subtilisin family serine protease